MRAVFPPVHVVLHAVLHSDYNYCKLNTTLLIRLLHSSRDFTGLQRYFDIGVIILVNGININICDQFTLRIFLREQRIAKWVH